MADIEENIVYSDIDHGEVLEPSRSIKFKPSSYDSIRSSFLKGRLESARNNALTREYSGENAQEKVARVAEKIAKLEEKILILSRDDVPEDYVSRRAIKLRKDMISNLRYHSNGAYVIGLDKKEEIFSDEAVEEAMASQEVDVTPAVETPYNPDSSDVVSNEEQEVVVPPVTDPVTTPPVEEGTDIDVVQSGVERQEIEDAINSSFEAAEKSGEGEAIGTDVIRDVIDTAMDQVDVPTDEVHEVIGDTDVPSGDDPQVATEREDDGVSRDVIRDVIDTAFQGVDEQQPSKEDIRSAVEEAFQNVSQDAATTEASPVVPEDRVSTSDAGQVHSRLYDENGNRRVRRKKYNYTPMTDAEIREAQIKLGFDEHGNLIDNGANSVPQKATKARVVGDLGSIPSFRDAFVPANHNIEKTERNSVVTDTPVREVPVVTPDRTGDEVKHVVTEEPVKDDAARTLDDYAALKARILDLVQKRDATHQRSVDAQRVAQESAREAQAARRKLEMSQASYQDRMKKLADYVVSLEATVAENVRQTEAAEEETRKNRDFVALQNEEAAKNDQIIGEIDSMIGDVQTPQDSFGGDAVGGMRR